MKKKNTYAYHGPGQRHKAERGYALFEQYGAEHEGENRIRVHDDRRPNEAEFSDRYKTDPYRYAPDEPAQGESFFVNKRQPDLTGHGQRTHDAQTDDEPEQRCGIGVNIARVADKARHSAERDIRRSHERHSFYWIGIVHKLHFDTSNRLSAALRSGSSPKIKKPAVGLLQQRALVLSLLFVFKLYDFHR